MAEGNGSPVTRAELAAHIKGIDKSFDDMRADVAEIKWAQHDIRSDLRSLADAAVRESWLGPRGRDLVTGAGFLSAAVAVLIALFFH